MRFLLTTMRNIKTESFFNINSNINNVEKYILNSLFIILIFLFINPIYAIFFTTFFSINNVFSKTVSLLTLVFSFSLFFFNREYDVNFYLDSTDDVPIYIDYYLRLSTSSILDIFDNFLKSPSGNEPFWHLIWWVVNKATNSNVNIFIFLHYLLIFYFFAKISLALFPKRFEFLFLLILFLFPVTLYNICHIWRQILSFEFFLFGSILFYQNNKKFSGLIYIILSVITHVSSFYFFIIFLSFNIFFNFALKLTKKNIIIFGSLIILTISFGINILLSVLGETFVRLSNYTDGASANRDGIGVKLFIYILITVYGFVRIRFTKFNSFLFINIITLFILPFIIPSFNAIYDRYFSLALTLLSVYLSLISVYTYKGRLYSKDIFLFYTISFLLIASFIKLYFEYSKGIGVISFIGSSSAFHFNNGFLFSLFKLIIL